jgi:RNA polymerase sigma-70 factor (ECF subfamily)
LRDEQNLTLIFRKKIAGLSDAEVLLRYRETGDQMYVGELYNRYRHLVFGVCLKYLKNAEDSRDATIALFEKMVTELLRSDVRQLGAWLHTITRNHCISLLRKKHSELSFEHAGHMMADNSQTELEQAVQRDSRLAALENALAELDEHQANCVRLFYIEEKSYKEIAADTGYTEMQVKSHIQNGRRNLKIQLTGKP